MANVADVHGLMGVDNFLPDSRGEAVGLADKIESEFPPGVMMPSELRRLCDFFDCADHRISGYMRLRPEGEVLKIWFCGDTKAAEQFAGFGAGPDGSILAFWLYRGADASSAPVVHLGSEGQNNVVLASDVRDFLRLLGIGYDELGFDDLSAPPTEPATAERLRAWLLAEFNITPPTTGAELVRQAQARHPDFSAWVEDWQRRRCQVAEPQATPDRPRDVQPIAPQPLTLDELLRGATDDNIPGEWDTGPATGKEVW
jgi:hypothetical protein